MCIIVITPIRARYYDGSRPMRVLHSMRERNIETDLSSQIESFTVFMFPQTSKNPNSEVLNLLTISIFKT